jgi:predicted dienelactone hydrolase
MRRLYELILRLHPKPFRERFYTEMLCIFDDGIQTEGHVRLIVDCFASMFRQWVLRSLGERSSLRVPEGTSGMFASPTIANQTLQMRASSLILGGAISLGLFVGSGALIGRGGKHPNRLQPIQSGTDDLAQTLMPSDLMSVSDECVPDVPTTCRLDASAPSNSASTNTRRLMPSAGAQTRPYELPFPSGSFAIGQVSYRFTDTPTEPLPDSATGVHELNVLIWYPASINSYTSERLQNVWNFSRATETFVQTHTVLGASIARGVRRFPLILFRPAVGNSSAAYLSQIENLVSHGYIVASVEPREKLTTLEFGDTRLTLFNGDLRRASFFPGGRTPQTVLRDATALEDKRESLASADLRFAFNQIILLGTGAKTEAPFAGRVDLERVGAFGHGSGGNAVVRFCGSDSRVSACLDENGWTPDGPILGSDRSGLPRQPFMWIDLPLKTPGDGELNYARLSVGRFERLRSDGEKASDLELRSLTKGGHRVSLLMPAINDKNFTDGPLIWSMRPQHREDSEARAALAITNVYARTFFDRYLNNKSIQLLDSAADSPFPNVRLQRYPAMKK